MMMDCPRCGFSQPKDRFCASCGLDLEHYTAKPKPVWIRVLQNPNFHLSLIAVLLVFVVGYILYSRSEMVTREVGQLLHGSPLSSREAGDPNDADEAKADAKAKAVPATAMAPAAANPGAAAGTASGDAQAVGTSASAGEGTASADTAAAGAADKARLAATTDPQKLDVGFWEVSRETLAAQISSSEKVAEGSEGRAYFFKDGTKAADAIRTTARRLTLNRSAPLQTGSQVMVVTPPSTPEPFQFGMAVQVSKFEGKEAALHFDSQLVLSQPETAAEMASQTPAMKTVTESALNGNATMNGNGLVLIVIEPSNRHPRDEYLVKAGEGPWSVFSSEDFRAGATDWVVMIQLK